MIKTTIHNNYAISVVEEDTERFVCKVVLLDEAGATVKMVTKIIDDNPYAALGRGVLVADEYEDKRIKATLGFEDAEVTGHKTTVLVQQGKKHNFM